MRRGVFFLFLFKKRGVSRCFWGVWRFLGVFRDGENHSFGSATAGRPKSWYKDIFSLFFFA